MVTVLKRPPHDQFTFRLFYKLSNKIPHADKIYTWSMVLEPNYQRLWYEEEQWKNEKELDFRKKFYDSVTSSVVVLGIKDHLSYKEFNPWTDDIPATVEYVKGFVEHYKDKTIILFTSVENLNQYLNFPNLHIISWGGDITNQAYEYKQLQPVTDKNFDSPYSYLSLNRNYRRQRVASLSTLFGLNLESTGLMSCMFKDRELELPDWPIPEDHVMNLGFKKFRHVKFNISDDENIYDYTGNTNAQNFDLKLRNYYSNTFVEIINETTYAEKSFLLTEKTLNCFYGCNFPILISSVGTVKLLREIGFDMFDDIIDHSYDLIENPIDRIYTAIYNNKDLLSGTAKTLWSQNKDRFLSNVDVAKTKMYEYYTVRAETEFMKILNGNIQVR